MNKPLTIEIHGTGTHNRGAELMAIAISDKLRICFSGVRIVVNLRYGTAFDRYAHGFYTTAEFAGRVRGVPEQFALQWALPKIATHLGIIDPKEIDLVIDASGFAFSDQWGASAAKRLLRKMNRTPRKDKPLVLMPQAWGPFANKKVARATKQLVQRAELVYARDKRSLGYLQTLLGPSDKIRMSPDFTLEVNAIDDPQIDIRDKYVAIVPNYRMIDKSNYATEYIQFLKRSVEFLSGKPVTYKFILHDSVADREVLKLIGVCDESRIFSHRDPRVLKSVLGKASFVIGSRFHALVSSLSQEVPCIAVGWSHKYRELFNDFDCSDMLIDELENVEALRQKIDCLCDKSNMLKYRQRIKNAAEVLKKKNEQMWQDLAALIRTQCKNPQMI